MLVGNAIGIPFSKALRRGIPRVGLVGMYTPAHKRNLAKWSHEIAKWSQVRGFIAGNKFIEDTTLGIHHVTQAITVVANKEYRFSVIAKAGERHFLRFAGNRIFNLQNGTITGITSGSTIEHLGDGVYLCSGTITPAGTTAYLDIIIRKESGSDTYEGDGVSGVFIYAVQYEPLALAGSLSSDFKFNQDNQTLWNEHKTPLNVTNFVQNGNFTNGVTGWSGSSATNSVSDNTLTNTGTPDSTGTCWLTQSPSRPYANDMNKKMYIRGRLRVTNSVCSRMRFYIFDDTTITIREISSPIHNAWYICSGVVTVTTNSMWGIYVSQEYPSHSRLGKELQAQEIMAINLTALFGAGNEPTAVQCDRMFANWFDGTVNMPLPLMPGQLGSTTGADVNDPAWTGNSLLFATDDYVQMPIPFDVSGDWTIYIVVKRDNMPSANEAIISLGNSSVNTQYIYLYKRSDISRFTFSYLNDAGQGVWSNLDALDGYRLLKMEKKNNQVRLKDVGANLSTAYSNCPASPQSLSRAALGVFGRTTNTNYLNGEIAYYMPYNRATTDAEDLRIYKALKKELAQRGIAI